MIKVPDKIKPALIYILLIIQLISFCVIKYINQGLALSEFSFFKTGNLFNLLIYFMLIAGIFISNKKQPAVYSSKYLLLITLASWVILIGAFVSTKVKIIPDSFFILSLPGDKIFTGLLFISYLFLLVYFILKIWIEVLFKKRTTVVRNIFNTVLLFILIFLIILIYVDNAGYSSGRWILNKNKNNIAVVLGAAVWSDNLPSPTLSSRVDKAIELLNEGFAGKIILTGGSAPGEMSESEVAFEYAKVKGVDTNKIVTESLTASTAEQIRWVKNNLSVKSKSDSDIILISDSYHLPRVIEISKFFNLDIKVAESSHKLSYKDKILTKVRECAALFNFWCFAL